MGALLIALASAALLGPACSATASARGLGPPLPTPLRVLSPFDPPTQPWGPGNRGVDLAARAGEPVFAAADGVVIYAGELAGRGVVSISHGDLRTTYEPVDPIVAAGEHVEAGQGIGVVADVIDACGPPGSCLHWGAIRGGRYIDPMSLLATPRAVRLLPIWTDGLPTAAPAATTNGPAARAAAAAARPGPAAFPVSAPITRAGAAPTGVRATLAATALGATALGATALGATALGAAVGIGALGRRWHGLPRPRGDPASAPRSVPPG